MLLQAAALYIVSIGVAFTLGVAQTKLVKMILPAREGTKRGLEYPAFLLLDSSEPSAKQANSRKFFGLLASPTEFEPVLPP
jgi:hypothetical protein